MSLRGLAGLLRHEPDLARVIGLPDATLAVNGPAQPFVIAGLLGLSERRPLVVVTATFADAERLAGDLSCFLTPNEPDPATAGGLSERVVVLPPWETLPFERVSPEVATMGTRLSVLWHLFAEGATRPDVVVAPVRAILQRLGPWRDAAAPVTLVEGQRIDAEKLVAQLVGQGYRREHQVEHRGELAVRGGIVDIFPSTADAPVRVDLFGDEIDRLTTFDVSDQRSIAPLGCAVVFEIGRAHV